ncbi:RagB/SusD family nutrient uptake outer membrane protein [Bacteroides sp. 51]|uniref:RagB/SusD family nutrient uptake outer membrane protein n=1 Tax=Bacteroides sp. 51 TaxID=2302938 RepID=UPI0013D55FEB|nr:RagB/SusD family nutrient uptake outer membrane protein [Bacteroides sp. 51]NDV82550.1 RagB/SusD family nutrient uptake outer membrane protein [Bacteroides sp. 51]
MKIVHKTNIIPWLLSTFVGVSMFFSCVDDINIGDRFLEKSPGVDVNIDTIFSKGEYAKNFLWQLYNHVNSPFYTDNQLNSSPIEVLSDILHSHCTWSGANEYYYPGNVTEDSQGDWMRDKFGYNSVWGAIRKGWILIENLDRVPDLTDGEISQLKGETYVIMATRYLDALKNFGGLPLVDHVFQPGENYTRRRGTVEQTVHFIDSLIVNAIDEPGLPWRVQDVENWAGRMTKGGAMALRAKLHLFAASPLFNDTEPYMQYTGEAEGQDVLHIWTGGRKQEYWEKCLQACEDFFRLNTQNADWYALIQPETEDENGYSQAFREAYWYRGNSEKLIEVHFAYTASEWEQNYGIGTQSHMGHTNPTLEYMEMFPMANGKNYSYQNIYGTNNPGNIDIFANRDPRLYESILVSRERLREDYMGLQRVEIWKGGNVYNNNNLNGWTIRFATGMALFKWILDYWKMGNQPVSYSYMRMAEMHLIYAEALAETGNLSKACEEINKVRARVGLGKIEVMNPELQLTTNKENLIREILRERAVEFGMEDQRLYDIIRRKEVDKFTSPLHELHTWRKTADGQKDTREDTQLQMGEAYPNFIYEKVQITAGARRWWEPGFWNNKWLLSPLPRAEINKGYGLTQNPGW